MIDDRGQALIETVVVLPLVLGCCFLAYRIGRSQFDHTECARRVFEQTRLEMLGARSNGLLRLGSRVSIGKQGNVWVGRARCGDVEEQVQLYDYAQSEAR